MTIIVTGGAGFIGSNFIFHMMEAHPDYRMPGLLDLCRKPFHSCTGHGQTELPLCKGKHHRP